MKHVSLVAWEFNHGAWSSAMREKVHEHGLEFVAGMMECTQNTVREWAKKPRNEGFPYPNMTNFMKFINWTDSDPREFFCLEDK